jgi:hypothetical protein
LPAQPELIPAATRALTTPNAGGRSEVSEAFSIDYFSRVHDATGFQLEMDVVYWINYRMVDFICNTPDGERLGVSVTRAMGWPRPDRFDEVSAMTLLYKKVDGLICARDCVDQGSTFHKSLLHVWCQTERIALLMNLAWNDFRTTEAYLVLGEGVLSIQLSVCGETCLFTNRFH